MKTGMVIVSATMLEELTFIAKVCAEHLRKKDGATYARRSILEIAEQARAILDENDKDKIDNH